MQARLAAAALLTAALAAPAALAQDQVPQDGEAAAKRGELLFNVGGCASCHTAKDGPALAGGYELKTPFGTFHPPNITPDPENGLGAWSEADFVRAMKEGVSPDGDPYYPAFPYTSYTHMTDADVKALWAYLQTVEPVAQPSEPHDLGFPYNLRFGLWPWRWVFFEAGELPPEQGESEAWNRGRYLVRAPGHCAECHSPRNFAGAIEEDAMFGGAAQGPDGKPVPDISQSENGLKGWSEGDLKTVLTLGMLPDGDFIGGEMGKVVENSTNKLPEEDLDAVVTYILSLPAR